MSIYSSSEKMPEQLGQSEIFEALGYLSHPNTAMRYDVQVPPKVLDYFEQEYKNAAGVLPGGPGGGYSILGAQVDKRNVQYRISYAPQGTVPSCLTRISREYPGQNLRKRISNKQLLWAMFSHGFVLGKTPDIKNITARIPSQYAIRFEFGYSAAFSDSRALKHGQFARGFSSVEIEPKGKFILQDAKEKANLVISHRIGRTAAFRRTVLQIYQYQCCICNDSLVDLSGHYETEAAHIVPKRLCGTDDIRNGLALCRKHHWAFDRGLFYINEDYCVAVPHNVSVIPENSSLLNFKGDEISLPDKSGVLPHLSALEWHRKNILLSPD